MGIRYAHTNIIATDWRRLADFYQKVFQCEFVPPERNLSEKWLEDATGVPSAALQGAHLRLPGYGETGPTLEIFSYSVMKEKEPAAADRKGFGHIAFVVENVESMVRRVTEFGGRSIGKIVKVGIPGAGQITFTYVADPEDNIVELQKWS